MSPICESFRNVPPSESIRKILILRTAPMAQVHGAVEHLRGLYPDAQFAVLGTFLGDGFFDGMQKFEVHDRWVTPRSCAPLRRRVEQERFNIAVLCLNSEHVVGYDRVSKVLQWISAELKLVAGYTGNWHLWQYGDFVEGGFFARWIVNSLLLLLYPTVALYLLSKPSRPLYLPLGRRQSAPRYGS